jgi:hypothetical protein
MIADPSIIVERLFPSLHVPFLIGKMKHSSASLGSQDASRSEARKESVKRQALSGNPLKTNDVLIADSRRSEARGKYVTQKDPKNDLTIAEKIIGFALGAGIVIGLVVAAEKGYHFLAWVFTALALILTAPVYYSFLKALFSGNHRLGLRWFKQWDSLENQVSANLDSYNHFVSSSAIQDNILHLRKATDLYLKFIRGIRAMDDLAIDSDGPHTPIVTLYMKNIRRQNESMTTASFLKSLNLYSGMWENERLARPIEAERRLMLWTSSGATNGADATA